jgi:uncharacterized RDD family membrane protein YckC
MLDTFRPVETPEGVEIGLRVAGPVPRLFAWSIDFAIRMGVYFLALMLLGILGESGMGLFFLVLFLSEWFYPVLFEVLGHGATPGKRAMALGVLHQDGTPVGWTSSILRNLLLAVDFLPLLYGFALASMLIDRDFRRLGDLAAGTVVVHRDQQSFGLRVPPAEPLRPPLPLNLDEQRAVIDFAERLGTWSEERARELAALATPLTSAGGSEGLNRLLAMANWLLGRR